jgi:hypothetical protein
VACADRDIVEQAEAARNIRRCMMAGRPDRGEGGFGLSAHHSVDAGDDGSGGAQGCLDATAAHDGVAVNHRQLAGGGAHAHHALNVVFRMDPQELFDRGGRRFGAREAGKRLVVERRQHRAQAVGAFRMVWPRLMAEAGGMGEEDRRHVRPPLRDAAWRRGLG